jgi:hypothetical protein
LEGFGQILMGAGNLIIACTALYNLWTARERAKAIQTLEKNTNSIKDALIKTIGEAEHAKGVLQGAAQATVGEIAAREQTR